MFTLIAGSVRRIVYQCGYCGFKPPTGESLIYLFFNALLLLTLNKYYFIVYTQKIKN